MPKYINQDGKRYEFTPGKGGSLTNLNKVTPKPIEPSNSTSKVILPDGMKPCDNCKEPLSTNAASCSACGQYQHGQAPVNVASPRG